MKSLRYALGFLAACAVGTLLPTTAVVYDGVYRHHHGSPTSLWIEPSWKFRLLYNAWFVAVGSALAGSAAGAVAVGLLHSAKRSRLRDYALSGAGIGALCGLLFCIVFNLPSDPVVAWLIFTILPSLSMTLGFICYWFISIRSHAS